MKKSKFIVLAMLLAILTMCAAACNVKTSTSESYTDEDGNTVTTTTTNDNGEVTTETTTSSDDEDEYSDEDGNAEEASDIPDSVQGFADNFDTLSGSDSTYVTKIEDQGGGTYKIHITDPTMYFTLLTNDGELYSAGVTVASSDADIIQGCFGFFVKALAADDVTEVVENVMAAADGTYETDFAKYGIQTDNSTEIPFITLSMVRK